MLIGRGSERATIDALLDDARAGRSGALVLRGEPGIGKTALLEYATEQAEDARVLRCLGVESELELAFSALHQLLRPVLQHLDDVPPTQADALRVAFALAPPAELDKFQVYAATLTLLATAAESTPLVCVVDDAQWIDSGSAEALLFATRRLTEEPIAVLFAAREGEERVFAAPGAPALHLEGLHREAAQRLLAETVAAPLTAEAVERVLEVSRGNPLAIIEMPAALDAGSGEPPPIGQTVERAFLRRVEALSEAARTALLVAAANDARDFTTVLAAVRELGLGPDAVEEAERVDLIRVEEGAIDFAHPLVRSAIYQAADARERRLVHAALAAVLRSQGVIERYPAHLAAASTAPDETVAAALAEGADAAGARGGAAARSYGYERAARMTPDPERRARRLLVAAKAGWTVGLERVETLCHEGIALTRDPALRGDLHAQLETALYWRGDLPAAHRIKMVTADELEATAPVQAAHMRARATASLKHFLRGQESVELSRKALELMRDEGGDDPRVPVMHLQSLVRMGDADEARALLAECAATVAEADDASLHANVAEACLLEDDLDAADALLDPWLQPARVLGDVSDLANGVEWSARLLQVRGDLRRAHAAALESLELNKLLPDEVLQTAESTLRLYAVLCAIGREDEAEPWFTPALELSQRCSSSFLEAQVYAARGALALSLGRAEEAVEDLERVREMIRGGGYRHPAFVQFSPELVEAYVRAGRSEDARAEQAELNADAQLVQTEWALAVAARCRGLLEGSDSDVAFEEALAEHEKSPRVLEKARTQLAYGERLRRAGQRLRAREQLRAAVVIFETCGAVAWADRARQELRTSGETTRAAETAREELSPQELQVALIVAEGASNKEAAARLFLSPKTIEFHLRNVFRKLGVRSRVEVANAMRVTQTASAEQLEARL